MLRILKRALLSLLLFLPLTLSAQKAADGLYMFGVGTSFNDSTIYLTAIQLVPGARLNPKTDFLENRVRYSNQLKAYLEMNFVGFETCTVFFADTKKEIEQKYIKLRRRYQKTKNRYLLELPSDVFSFQQVE